MERERWRTVVEKVGRRKCVEGVGGTEWGPLLLSNDRGLAEEERAGER